MSTETAADPTPTDREKTKCTRRALPITKRIACNETPMRLYQRLRRRNVSHADMASAVTSAATAKPYGGFNDA